MQIDVVDATISYKKLSVFDHFSAHFEGQKSTALVGPSGSGKSSLLSAIGGHTRLTAGVINFLRETGEITNSDPSLIAWVPQSSSTISGRSALDNVLIAGLARGLSLKNASNDASDYLFDVGLADRRFHLARELSGGELQRVAFARALATEKPIILADEPSSSLDAQNTEMLGALLNSLQDRTTIIVATHDPIIVSALQKIVEIRRPS